MNCYDRFRQEFFRLNDPQFPYELFVEGIPSIKLLTIVWEGEQFDLVFDDEEETWVLTVPKNKEAKMFLHKVGAEDLAPDAVFGKERTESMLETVLVALEKVEA